MQTYAALTITHVHIKTSSCSVTSDILGEVLEVLYCTLRSAQLQ